MAIFHDENSIQEERIYERMYLVAVATNKVHCKQAGYRQGVPIPLTLRKSEMVELFKQNLGTLF